MHDVRSARAATAHRARRFAAASPTAARPCWLGTSLPTSSPGPVPAAAACAPTDQWPTITGIGTTGSRDPSPLTKTAEPSAQPSCAMRWARHPYLHHRRRQYRAKLRYRSEVQHIKRRMELKAKKKAFPLASCLTSNGNFKGSTGKRFQTVVGIAKPADTGIVPDRSYWMMLRLSVSRRQTQAVAPVWCSNLPVKELAVPAPKWSTPCHRIRRSCAIPLNERAI
jgi:hypothetical protein